MEILDEELALLADETELGLLGEELELLTDDAELGLLSEEGLLLLLVEILDEELELDCSDCEDDEADRELLEDDCDD